MSSPAPAEDTQLIRVESNEDIHMPLDPRTISLEFTDLLKGCYNFDDACQVVANILKHRRKDATKQVLAIAEKWAYSMEVLSSNMVDNLKKSLGDDAAFDALELAKHYPSIYASSKRGKDANAEIQKLAAALSSKWGLSPAQFPYWN
jgi:glutamyl-tRNA reductase